MNTMVCKICGKNISGFALTCRNCRMKYKNAKPTCIPNGTQYIAEVFAAMHFHEDPNMEQAGDTISNEGIAFKISPASGLHSLSDDHPIQHQAHKKFCAVSYLKKRFHHEKH